MIRGTTDGTIEHWRARAEAAEAKLTAVRTLFADGGPDTPCRTTWRPAVGTSPVQCVEVPMADLQAVLNDAPSEQPAVVLTCRCGWRAEVFQSGRRIEVGEPLEKHLNVCPEYWA